MCSNILYVLINFEYLFDFLMQELSVHATEDHSATAIEKRTYPGRKVAVRKTLSINRFAIYIDVGSDAPLANPLTSSEHATARCYIVHAMLVTATTTNLFVGFVSTLPPWNVSLSISNRSTRLQLSRVFTSVANPPESHSFVLEPLGIDVTFLQNQNPGIFISYIFQWLIS